MASNELELEALAARAAEVAREAGALIRQRYALPRQIASKSVSVDLVTDTDREAEHLILDRIRTAYPGHMIVSEEAGTLHPVEHDGTGICWVIDPLDGTTNFAHGVPHFAVSIAAVRCPLPSGGKRPASFEPRDARPLVGAVFDPMRDELFLAHAGTATTLNGQAVEVSHEGALGASLLATGFPYDRRENAELYLSFWRTLLVRARDVRRIGAAALDLAWVACGRVDAFWEWRLKPWDVAAGVLLVRAAGGRVSDFGGGDCGVEAVQLLASNGELHDELVQLLGPLVPRP